MLWSRDRSGELWCWEMASSLSDHFYLVLKVFLISIQTITQPVSTQIPPGGPSLRARKSPSSGPQRLCSSKEFATQLTACMFMLLTRFLFLRRKMISWRDGFYCLTISELFKTKVTNFQNVKLKDKVALEPETAAEAVAEVRSQSVEIQSSWSSFFLKHLSAFSFHITHIHSTALWYSKKCQHCHFCIHL